MSSNGYGNGSGNASPKSDERPPVGKGKSMGLAFIVGLLFGPFGVGLYLRSWADFFILLAIVIGGSMFTVGVGAPVFWILCGAWGAIRVSSTR
ncbi:MAG: hypothetical protein KF699_03125 [Phycisphaeraceae bacterium]|nr:hypothetical protein [Phycisphaeraceae bacterium]